MKKEKCEKANIPVWAASNEVKYKYPWLSQDTKTQVCIIGSGITAAMSALEFTKLGVDVTVLADTAIGFNTDLCDGVICSNFEGDLFAMCEKEGSQEVLAFHSACNHAVENLKSFLDDRENILQKSYMTDNIAYTISEDIEYELRKEYIFSRHNSMNVDILTHRFDPMFMSLPKKFQFGLIYRGQSVVVDPYIFVQEVIHEAEENGATIYEYTTVKNLSKNVDSYEIETMTGKKVTAEHIIVTDSSLRNNLIHYTAQRGTAFTIMTNKIDQYRETEVKCPVVCSVDYPKAKVYVTKDGRIIASGLTSGSVSYGGKIAGILPTESVGKNKYRHLLHMVRSMFPQDWNIKCEHVSSCNYIMSSEYFPFVSCSDKDANVYLAFPPRDNQIIFANIAAKLLIDKYKGEENDLWKIFNK